MSKKKKAQNYEPSWTKLPLATLLPLVCKTCSFGLGYARGRGIEPVLCRLCSSKVLSVEVRINV